MELEYMILIMLYEGCRAWGYSDNGFAGGGGGYIEYKNCWAFDGGLLNGEGCGFKLRASIRTDLETIIPIQRKLMNCIGAMNGHYGFSDNNRGYTRQNSQYFSCVAYHNGYKDCGPVDIGPMGWGWMNYNFYGDVNGPNWLTANSVSFDNEQHVLDPINTPENYYFVAYDQAVEWPEETNSWNTPPGITISNSDFVSLDWTELLLPRKVDNSLPDINFMRPVAGSLLINAGSTVTGLPYSGSAPDIGIFEYTESAIILPTVITSAVTDINKTIATSGGNVSSAGGGTISVRGICWSTLINPTVSDSKTTNGSGTGVFVSSITGLTEGLHYYVRAYATNEIGTAYGSNVEFDAVVNDYILTRAMSFKAHIIDTVYVPVLPVFVNATIENATPSILEMNYDIPLANITPAVTAFTVLVNSVAKTVTLVSISGNKVSLTLAIPNIVSTDVLTVAYTKPILNPIQSLLAEAAVSLTAQLVTNNVVPIGVTQIIADHNAVTNFANIPLSYITEVKKMLVYFSGRSHSGAYRTGLDLLEEQNGMYDVNRGTGEAYTTSYLRCNENPSGYVYTDVWFSWLAYPVGSWPTESTWVTDLIQEYHDHGHPFTTIAYAWCWDIVSGYPSDWDLEYGCRWFGYAVGNPSGNDDMPMGLNAADKALTGSDVSMDTYLSAIEYYRNYCNTHGINTKVLYTTGPVEGTQPGENAWQSQVKHDYIRAWVAQDSTRILFDFADILAYDNNGSHSTAVWDGHTYEHMTPTNVGDGSVGHISPTGAVRLAKAQWWMLARIAGWDGVSV